MAAANESASWNRTSYTNGYQVRTAVSLKCDHTLTSPDVISEFLKQTCYEDKENHYVIYMDMYQLAEQAQLSTVVLLNRVVQHLLQT